MSANPDDKIEMTVAEYEAELTKRFNSAEQSGKREMAKKLDALVREKLAAGLTFDGMGMGVHVEPRAEHAALKAVMDEIGSWVK